MMEQRFALALERLALPKGCRVTVALSGGMDSVTLLYLLKQLQGKDFTLAAAHVHHGLRQAAEQDLQFCVELCEKWQIPLQVFRGDAAAYAAEHGMSPEEGARALRYGFLDPLVGENAFVATAHHREDQLETFFINLYRGSGSRGLSGMRPQREGYIRPMLGIERSTLAAYAAEHALPFVTDETNADPTYLRNFLRHQVLPLLQSRAEGDFAVGLAASMEILREEDAALCTWAEQVTDAKVETLAPLPDAVLKRVLDQRYGRLLDRRHFREIAALIRRRPASGQVQINGEDLFRIEYGECNFTPLADQTVIPIQPNVEARCGNVKFMVLSEEINSPFTHFMLDCDKIKSNLVFRHKKPGDEFRPMGKGGTSRLQKRLKNDRVPRSRRDALWVLADEQDRVLWVEGYGADRAFGCDEQTKRVFLIKIGG